MQHRFVMVSGVCFGAGKSTLAAAVAAAIARRGLAVRLLSEDELLARDVFARFDRELGASDARAIGTLLEAARSLAAEVGAEAPTLITDALLPGFTWLLGRYPIQVVAAYADELAGLLRPLRPLFVYLDGEAPTLFNRAVMDRGAAFRERIVAAVGRWPLPYYPAGPVRDEAAALHLFAWLGRQTLALLDRWPGAVLVMDATKPVAELTECAAATITARADGLQPGT